MCLHFAFTLCWYVFVFDYDQLREKETIINYYQFIRKVRNVKVDIGKEKEKEWDGGAEMDQKVGFGLASPWENRRSFVCVVW